MASKISTKTKAQARADVADKRRRRRKGKNTLYYFMALFVCMAAGVILSFTVFFRLDNITVIGNTMYSDDEIIATSEIRLGDNMFRVVQAEVNKAVTAKFPYIEFIKIKRRLPTSISIDVTMAEPAAVLPTQDGAILITPSGRVIAKGSAADYPEFSRIEGLDTPSLQVMEVLGEEHKANMEMVLGINAAIKAEGLEKIKIINLGDTSNVCLLYDDRLIIKLGSLQELNYKLRFAKSTIDQSVERTFVGVLDVSVPPYARLRRQNIYTQEVWCFSNEYLEQIMPFIIPPTTEQLETENATA